MTVQIDPKTSLLHTAVAAEIRDIRCLLEQLAETLVSDERFAMDYLEQLQTFDLVIQRAEESANLLERIAHGSTCGDAIDQVRLTLVQDRLRNAVEAG